MAHPHVGTQSLALPRKHCGHLMPRIANKVLCPKNYHDVKGAPPNAHCCQWFYVFLKRYHLGLYGTYKL